MAEPTKEQQLAEIQKLATKHGVKLGTQPLVTDLLVVLQKLDAAEGRAEALEHEISTQHLHD